MKRPSIPHKNLVLRTKKKLRPSRQLRTPTEKPLVMLWRSRQQPLRRINRDRINESKKTLADMVSRKHITAKILSRRNVAAALVSLAIVIICVAATVTLPLAPESLGSVILGFVFFPGGWLAHNLLGIGVHAGLLFLFWIAFFDWSVFAAIIRTLIAIGSRLNA